MCIERARQHGLTLVELIIYIVVVSIAVAGVLLVMNRVTEHSADTLVHKQALAIAESLLEEVELMPMTYCDPNDPVAATADPYNRLGGGAIACSGGMSEDVTTGPVPGTETRGSTTDPFDNVADYGGYSMNGIKDISGSAISGLTGYSASAALTRVGTSFIGGTAVAGDALRISVTVTAPDGSTVVLDGYRARYAPNEVP